MEITKSVLSARETAFLYGDYSSYRSQLSTKLYNCRKRLNIASKNRGKYQAKQPVTAAQVAENNEYVLARVLTDGLVSDSSTAMCIFPCLLLKGLGQTQ
jgi:signal recognition particle subunit SRP68